MAVVVSLQVATAEGIEQTADQPKTLDFAIGVEGVAECEVISVLMAAIARILVMPVTALARQSSLPRLEPKMAFAARL